MERQTKIQVLRKRGRPPGKNRVPLSQEEQRARNAHYERERREEQSQAATMLAEAAGCEPNLPLILLLDRVTSYLKKSAQRDSSDNVTALRSLNENLMNQVTTLEERLYSTEAHSSFLTSSYGHEEIPVRTHCNQIHRKMIKLDKLRPEMYPTPSPEPYLEHPASLTLDSVLDDVISLEEEKIIKQETFDCSQWTTCDILDGVISLEADRKAEQQVPNCKQWSDTICVLKNRL